MLRKLKTLDKVLLVTSFLIVAFAGLSGFAVNQILSNLISNRAESQIVLASEMMARTVATEMDSGNFRDAWKMIHLNVGKNNFTDFLLLDGNGQPLISDVQSEENILPLWRNSTPFILVNESTKIKKLDRSGKFLSEFKYNNLGNSEGAYSLLFFFNDNQIAAAQFQITLYIFGYVFLLFIFIGYLIFFFRSKLLKAIAKINYGLDSILQGKTYEDEGSIFSEYVQSKQTLEKFALDFKETKIILEDQVKIKVLGELTRQVAHDIRSPLSALNMVMNGLSEISEEKRLLIRNAVQRINDISNDLLQKGKRNQVQSNSTSAILLSAIADSIVSEKRIQFRDKINIKIELDLQDSFGIFVNANATELSRCISNLIDNSVEALKQESGEIGIIIRGDQTHSTITIKDNGIGIPEEILVQLGSAGFSHGKNNSENSGSGIGVYHAKKTVEEWDGDFKIRSTVGKGTAVEIKLLKAEIPSWFPSSIRIPQGATVITVDDDLSIHQIWKGRLESIQAKESGVGQKSFTSANEFLNFALDDSMIFLIDYEFLNQSENGLGLIKEKNIASRSILVTSRYEESFIKETCERLKIKLLPKQLSGFIPMEIETTSYSKEIYDYILIDDDELVRMTWEMRAKQNGKKIKIYSSHKEFLLDIAFIDHTSHLFVDVSLGDGVRGEEVAKQLFEIGYTNISLTTGYDAEDIEVPHFIKQVLGKSFPK